MVITTSSSGYSPEYGPAHAHLYQGQTHVEAEEPSKNPKIIQVKERQEWRNVEVPTFFDEGKASGHDGLEVDTKAGGPDVIAPFVSRKRFRASGQEAGERGTRV
eukprot:Protomagalhaensia_sp_Gyna_25__4200@NODE_3814_length_438_cov_15_466165_g3249_i0_p2_GENE_NODE_3814_length_438_cov_15_466165_g3249_i0NODE_3814_length_438_cov_15_466165_g3249_i0_p2_ORF_typecomplete_len104_score7_48_NODE_3814_length_438_cov_15_466165_g3249_i016327